MSAAPAQHDARTQTGMIPALDLAAYFARIGYHGEQTPVLPTLASLLDAHMRAIPFENLDVLLGRPPRLDLPALQAKLVTAWRGGYCFEHATLFAAVLERLGFVPTRHTARVVLYAPRTAVARTHMVLTVPIGRVRYVVDPGFGGLAPRTPVPLVAADSPPAGATHFMARDDGHWVLRARKGDAIVDCWATTLDADNLIDFEVGNHYTATHHASPFVNRLMLRAITPDGEVAVMNRDATIVANGIARSERLADRAALRALLAAHFGFDLPEVLAMRIPAIEEWT